MDKIEDLPEKLQPIVRNAIADCRFRGIHKSVQTEIGEVYVYRTPRGVAWGINSKHDGCNLKRGVEQ